MWAQLFTILINVIVIECDVKLIMSHAVVRHGARAPISEFTTSEASSFFYRGKGHLTDLGYTQAATLGNILSKRYIPSFLDKRMLVSEVNFRSSASERCLMTTSTVAANMFPNRLPPVFTKPGEDDYMLVPKFLCDEYIEQYKKKIGSEVKDERSILEMSYKAMSDASVNMTHLVNKNPDFISSLLIEEESGLVVPQWFNATAKREADKMFYYGLASLSGVGPYHNPSWIRTKSGELFDTILKKLKVGSDFVYNKTSQRDFKKFSFYGTHDIVILSLLESLGIRENAVGEEATPGFCATILFELYDVNGKPKIQVYYRSSRDDNETLHHVTQFIPNCKGNEYCPAEFLVECCQEFRTSDAKTECVAKENNPINTLSLSLIGLSMILFIAVLFLTCYTMSLKRSIVQ